MGKARNLKKRIASYKESKNLDAKTRVLVSKVKKVRHIIVTSELEALLLEASLIKKYLPFFNTRARDDKHPLYIKITTGDEFPRVFTVRREEDPKSTYFGPFPSSSTVYSVARLLRGVVPFDTQKNIGKRACFWSHLGLCNPCPSEILKETGKAKIRKTKVYKMNIKYLIRILSRQSNTVRKSLERNMQDFVKKQNFEEAAKIRDQITRLDYITKSYHNIRDFIENPDLILESKQTELKTLLKLLKEHYVLRSKPRRIECFDASHTSMVNPTVGMVTFINGVADKNYYRRFRIKTKGSRDDLAFLEEALRRRFSHPEWGIPDLLIIDGGKIQVGLARKVIGKLKLRIPVVGIVKPYDNLVIPHQKGFQILRLKAGPAKNLLQRIRDETHRFSLAYHRKLRSTAFLV